MNLLKKFGIEIDVQIRDRKAQMIVAIGLGIGLMVLMCSAGCALVIHYSVVDVLHNEKAELHEEKEELKKRLDVHEGKDSE
jgi:hypothetical protein